MSNLPTGTVTFLFTDIEGSTRLAQQHPAEMPALLRRHNEILRQAIESHHGYVFQIVGDSFSASFHTPQDAVLAAQAAQRALNSQAGGEIEPLRVRMGLHTGAAQLAEDGLYSGYTTLAATQRIMAAGHGGQILISRATRELIDDSLPPEVGLSDLGEKRLKDLLYPEHLYQLNIAGLPTNFPPLRTLEAFPNNLPAQLTSFIGRESEIAEIKRSLDPELSPSADLTGAGKARLVTLTGSGGTGKTRLSLQVAAELLKVFKHGIWFIELAPLADPELIPRVVLAEIGVIEGQGRPPIDVLKEYLRDKISLIILDNCEHLISACARLVNNLLTSAPGLTVLATSREALGVRGELSYPVPSLSLPVTGQLTLVEELLKVESVRLFVDRALLANPHFNLDDEQASFIAQICSRLDGIPLAIELAAARVKAFSPEQISNRLTDRFRLLTGGSRTALPRQQTLRALIDWSYDLLADQERLLLLRLSVFSGGWTLDAAEQVCAGARLEAYDILDLLSQLVNKSLVVVIGNLSSSETRYRMLETIRQYAREKLFESGSGDSIRDRHLDYYFQMVKRVELAFYSPKELTWLVWLDAEWDNLRAAVEWALETRPSEGLDLVNCLSRLIEQNWHVGDMYNWFSQLVPHVRNSGRTAVRGRGLLGWAHCIGIGAQDEEVSSAIFKMDEALSIFEELRDRKGIAQALRSKGSIYSWAGNPVGGIFLLEQSLNLSREIGDKPGIATSLHWLGFAPQTHETPRKLIYLKESLSIHRELGDVIGIIEVLKQLGAIELRQGNFKLAHTWLDEALSLLQEHSSVLGGSKTVAYDIGDLAYYEGNYVLAGKYYQECLAWAERVGSTVSIGYAKARLGYLALHFADLPKATDYLHQALILFQKLGHIHGAAFTLDWLASLAVVENRWREAAQLLAYATLQYDEILGPRPPVEQKNVDQNLRLIRSHLSQAEWNEFSAMGRSLTSTEVVQGIIYKN
jgi:predicted ATPase/class 3 adenylate cyclase